MRFTYSDAIDALYVHLVDTPADAVVRQREIAPGVVVDFDAQGKLLGMEVLGASRHVPRDKLRQAGPPPPQWLTLKEAAAEAAAEGEPISPDTLRSQAAKGKLKTEKRGRDLVVARHELWNYLDNRGPTGRRAAGSVSAAARARAPAAKGRPAEGMPPKQFTELLKSVRLGGAILRGEAKPARVTKGGIQPDGSVILDCTPPDFMSSRPPTAGKARPTRKRAARVLKRPPSGGATA